MIVMLVLMAVSVSAQDGLALMKVEVGARPTGMGGAFVSILDGPNSSPYNPAAAARTSKFTVSLSHLAYWSNIRIETGYFATNLTGRSWLHGGIRYAADDNLEHRGITASSEPDYMFNLHDVSFKAGFAYQVTDQLIAGVAFGWFAEKIDIYQGSTFNADLGLLYEVNSDVNVGASVANLGSDFTISSVDGVESAKIALPVTYRVGGSYTYNRYLGAADIVVLDDEFHLHLGAEAWLHEYFALRSGYMANYDTKSFTAGASFVQRNFTVEYAFVPYSGALGTSHLFNLTVSL
ncbi:MAG: hypothetical protein DRP45_02405 [Candidatus Zixiibacteriota bacterium]|nr:MAG: hypothetical protein DRP45_02405 [candidate division Zixibacteria bacterium]